MPPFTGLAANYRQFRPALPPAAANYLWETASRYTTASRLLDVGTGTGTVMLALTNRFEQMIGIDPEMEMLEVASESFKHVLAERKLIRLFCSRIEDFTPPDGWKASLVTFSRSFHWVEQDATLCRLVDFTEPNGLVALMSDRSLLNGDEPWQKATDELLASYLGETSRITGLGSNRKYREWADVLKASPFNIVERAVFPVQRVWTYESILGYLNSTSMATRRNFGDRAEDFEAALKQTLNSISNTDEFIENDDWEVIIGRKIE